jgi:hypothetical protein
METSLISYHIISYRINHHHDQRPQLKTPIRNTLFQNHTEGSMRDHTTDPDRPTDGFEEGPINQEPQLTRAPPHGGMQRGRCIFSFFPCSDIIYFFFPPLLGFPTPHAKQSESDAWYPRIGSTVSNKGLWGPRAECGNAATGNGEAILTTSRGTRVTIQAEFYPPNSLQPEIRRHGDVLSFRE